MHDQTIQKVPYCDRDDTCGAVLRCMMGVDRWGRTCGHGKDLVSELSPFHMSREIWSAKAPPPTRCRCSIVEFRRIISARLHTAEPYTEGAEGGKARTLFSFTFTQFTKLHAVSATSEVQPLINTSSCNKLGLGRCPRTPREIQTLVQRLNSARGSVTVRRYQRSATPLIGNCHTSPR